MSAVHAVSCIGEADFVRLDAGARVDLALRCLPGAHALSSSFGAQAAVMLHLVNERAPGIPVILIDTGYLFSETYQFVDALSERLRLNLHVYRASTSSGWQEARHGKLWEQGVDGLERYNQLNKVEPMQRALNELRVGSWFAGLRRSQASTRSDTPFLDWRKGRAKVHPIADWSDRDVFAYLSRHRLPYHPLWARGYVSIGDTHSTVPLGFGMREEDTRFGGVKRECGLHTEL
jgi:phosphoadenosine phosphosulfate reductase